MNKELLGMTKSSAGTELPWAFLRLPGPRLPRVFGHGDDLRTIINLYSVRYLEDEQELCPFLKITFKCIRIALKLVVKC